MFKILNVLLMLIGCFGWIACNHAVSKSPGSEISSEVNTNLPSEAEKMEVVGENNFWKCSVKLTDPNNSFVKVQFLSNSEGIAISSNGFLFKTTDGGQKWQSFKVGITKKGRISDIYFVSSQIGWITIAKEREDYLNELGDESVVLKTEDGGKSWKNKFSINSVVIEKVSFPGEKEGWVIGRKTLLKDTLIDQIFVNHTNDGGETWSDITGDLPESLNDMAEDIIPTKLNEALLLTNGIIYKILANEKKLILLANLDERPQTYFGSFGLLPNDNLWAAGGADSKEGIWGILKKKEGNIWKSYETNAYLRKLIFISENEIFASGHFVSDVTSKTDIVRKPFLRFSNNGGKSWENVCGDKSIAEISFFYFMNTNRLWAIGDNKIILLERL